MQRTKVQKRKVSPVQWVADVFYEGLEALFSGAKVFATTLAIGVALLLVLFVIYHYVKPPMLSGALLALYLIFLIGLYRKYS